jgi:hypothetical protein
VEPVTSEILRAFLARLGERIPGAAELYLLGGSALCLLGSPRETMDVDYSLEPAPGVSRERLQAAIVELASEMHLDLEELPLAEFIPLPPGAQERRQKVGHFGRLTVYIFDPYSIALSKIARGFESELEDVVFMLEEQLIEFRQLEQHFNAVLPDAAKADIIPSEFRAYFEELRRRIRP